MRCNNCGCEVSGEGEGTYTIQYGFICWNCSSALHMTVCARCGQRFPFSEMAESDGDAYCKPDYTAYIKPSEKAKPPAKPIKKAAAAVAAKVTPLPSKTKYKEPYEIEEQAERILEGESYIGLNSADKKDTVSSLLDTLKRLVRGK